MFSNLLQHRQGSPPLPPQMRLVVAPMHSLPGKDSADDNDDNDDLSVCRDDLSQNLHLDEDSYLNETSSAAVDGQARVKEMISLSSELDASHDTASSPCPTTKSKKSRKGKTPLGMKGGRRGGGTHNKPSDDPILVDLQRKGSGSRAFFGGEEIRSAVRNQSNAYDVLDDDTSVTVTTVEAICTNSGSQGERIDCYWDRVDLSDSCGEERILSFSSGSKNESHGSVEIDLNLFGTTSSVKATSNEAAQSDSEKRTGSEEFSNEDLTVVGSSGERVLLHGASDVQSSCWFENRTSAVASKTSETASTSQRSRGQQLDSHAGSDDQSSWSLAENLFSEGLGTEHHHSERPIVVDGDTLCASRVIEAATTQAQCASSGQGEKIASHTDSEKHIVAGSFAEKGGSYGGRRISDDRPDSCISERSFSDAIFEETAKKSFVRSGLVREGEPGPQSANQELDSDDSDIEEISVDEFQTAEERRKGFAVRCTKRIEAGDSRNMATPAFETDLVQGRGGERIFLDEKCAKDLQQKSLTSFFPIRKHGTVPSSIYRKARNGDICKVLEDHSTNARNAPLEGGSKGKSSEFLQGFGKERVQAATLIIDSDDDEILEISVAEFKQSSLIGKLGVTGRKDKNCSLSNFR